MIRRTFVQEGIYDEFIKRSIELVKKRKLGDAFENDVVQGPQVDEKIFNRILKYVEAGKKEGAKLEFGGKRWGNEGYFIEPTIFSGVTDGMIIAREEIFGPVMSVFKFKTLDEVIERSNNTNYGLASGVITNDYPI
uniref:Aldehyde dehydrogenase domain-containing protein n=1 Tax=Phlebotomus papatasi TaxID=29031 RepID=A0A1B0DC07_PHLPP